MPEEILRNIYRIEVPLPRNPLRLLNSYLIRGEKSSLLIDTGFRQPECREALFSALDELGVDRETLDVFGTHIHSDHIGLAAEAVGKNRSIYLGSGDFHWSTNAENDRYWALMDEVFPREGFPREGIAELVDKIPARNFGPPLDLPQYTITKEGDSFDLGGHHFEVVEAPGHTPGMVCLWLPQEGVMFTADHILFDITPNITMWPNMEDALGSYLDSLRRFRTFPVKRALPGHRHGGDYRARIDELLTHHEHRVAETERIVQAGTGQTCYEIAGQMTWKITAKNWAEFPVIQKWFAVGEALSHLDYLRLRGRITREERNGLHYYR
jgi:glyoxylase-like metal-dependent hydrolase (beta-lactamase superfamily II)